MIKEVNILDNVAVFTKEIIAEWVAIHPDDDFADMINVETEKSTYTPAEAELRNSLMSKCFEVCEQHEIPIMILCRRLI